MESSRHYNHFESRFGVALILALILLIAAFVDTATTPKISELKGGVVV